MDSENDTNRHITRVQELLSRMIIELQRRGQEHDLSKLGPEEKPTFDEFSPKLKASTFGSEEYKGFLAAMKPALDHHYASNRHHPEHSELWKCKMCGSITNGTSQDCKCPACLKGLEAGILADYQVGILEPYVGLEGMTLIDLIEMFCDWKAASERHATGDVLKSVEINVKRFNIGYQLRQILINTAKELSEIVEEKETTHVPDAIRNEKEKIDAMPHEEMCRLWRFAPAGHPYFVGGSELCTYFMKRFKEKGGMTSEVSKRIGW